MKKIIVVLILWFNSSFAFVETGSCNAAGILGVWCWAFPVYSSSYDFNIKAMFQEIDDLLESKVKGKGQQSAESLWNGINVLFDQITEANVKKLKLLNQINAIKQVKNIDEQEVIFNIEKEKQLINKYSEIISIQKGK